MQPKLSICICSIPEREYLLRSLVAHLAKQDRFHECELVIILDGKQATIGEKRNRAMEAARGQYIACIDDDDTTAPDYIPRILEAIDGNSGIDAILIRGHCLQDDGRTVSFDYEVGGIEGEWRGDTIWRSPGHLCPIRSDIAKRARFPGPMVRGEDLAWSLALRTFINTSARAASRVLPEGRMYLYRLDRLKNVPRTMPMITPHKEIFTPQYTRASGPGSTVGYSQPYRGWLALFVATHKIKSIFEHGCGDGVVMTNALIGSDIDEYIGFDVIDERIKLNREIYAHIDHMMWSCMDIREAPLDADLIICKDVLQHWSNTEVKDWLDRLMSHRHRFRFALITNCNYGPTINTEIQTGGWRALDITRAPFGFGHKVFHWGDEIGGYKDVVLIEGLKTS